MEEREREAKLLASRRKSDQFGWIRWSIVSKLLKERSSSPEDNHPVGVKPLADND